jgi:hypothetical protein
MCFPHIIFPIWDGVRYIPPLLNEKYQTSNRSNIVNPILHVSFLPIWVVKTIEVVAVDVDDVSSR